jgi:hypothetical protein
MGKIYCALSKTHSKQGRVSVTGTADRISVYLSVLMYLPEDDHMGGWNM